MGMRKLAAGAVVALGLILPGVASAATFTVNIAADTTVPGGCTTEPACSLRDAVGAATLSTDPSDRIEIPSGTYLLSLGELSLTGSGPIVIHGAGARSTVIDAQGKSRVFRLSGGEATIEGVTVTGGSATELGGEELAGDGGGILVVSSEKVNIVRSTVSGNVAQQNGGGISAPPESMSTTALNVVESTVAANRVSGGAVEGLGGGIYALGDLTLVNSTVTGNRAENTVGMVQGGGVLVGVDIGSTKPTAVTILNSTIAGNSVPAGGVGGGLTVYNPGPAAAALSVKNTIVAGNTSGGTPLDCGTVALTSSANNLSSDASCQFSDPGSKQNANPLLGALQDNGGPTNTMALSPGSPAIDAGTNTGCPVTDQRGVARPQGPACDIGAFELAVVPPPPVARSADLRLRLKAKPKRPKTGGRFSFKLSVANRGPDAATGVVLKGTVPALARKVKGPKLKGKRACKLAKSKGGKRKLTCRLGTLASGKSRTLRIVVGSGDRARKLRASAGVRSPVADPRPKNGRAKAVAKVVRHR
jgi:hypothetical protein